MTYSFRAVITTLIIIVSTVILDVSWKHYTEISTRIQAQYNLKQAQVCVNDLLLKNNNSPIYSINISNDDIEKALKTCAREMRTTPTGDMFAFDLRTKEFIFDPSLDCFIEGGKFMTIESECSLHNDKELCNDVLKEMSSGYNSDIHKMTFWKFDDAKEYLEWVILPSEQIGFDGVERGGLLKPKQVLLAQGVQEDEIWARYSHFRMVLHTLGFLSIIFILLLDIKDNEARTMKDATSRDL